jgi:XTP/dITP diphosphohydrolase
VSETITFVTSNKAKVLAMQTHVEAPGFSVLQRELALIEPQADSIEEVARSKAEQAFQILRAPLVVEDSSFCVDALMGFPGPYTRYVLSTIGVTGLLRLAASLESRICRFFSVLVYIDSAGGLHTFTDEGVGRLAYEVDSTPYEEAWSDLWRIFIPEGASKPITALTTAERDALLEQWQATSVYTRLAAWLQHSRTARPE